MTSRFLPRGSDESEILSDMMAQLLEKNSIPVPDGGKKKDGSSISDNKEKRHAFEQWRYGRDLINGPGLFHGE